MFIILAVIIIVVVIVAIIIVSIITLLVLCVAMMMERMIPGCLGSKANPHHANQTIQCELSIWKLYLGRNHVTSKQYIPQTLA